MEKALAEVPDTLAAKKRWLKISKMVDGKTPGECQTKFKKLNAK